MPKKGVVPTGPAGILRCLWLWSMVQPALATLRFRALPGSWREVRVRVESWYHVSLFVQSPDGQITVAEVFKNDTFYYGLRAIASRSSGSMEALVHMDVGETLGVRATRRVGMNSLFTITRVPYKNFRSLKQGGYTSSGPSGRLSFSLVLRVVGWRNSLTREFQSTAVPGIYWLTATLVVGSVELTEGVIRTKTQPLFAIYGIKNCSVSVAGAVGLRKNTKIIVQLPRNLPYAGVHTYFTLMQISTATNDGKPAWTGYLDQNATSRHQKRLSLSTNLLDKGGMYDWRSCQVTVPVTGFYLVSLRVVPPGALTTVVKVYQNRLAILKVFGERGVPTCNTHVLWIERGDTLFAAPDPNYSSIMRDGTFLSVAFFSW